MRKKKKAAGNKWHIKEMQNSDRHRWWLARLFMAFALLLATVSCTEEKEQLPANEVFLSLSFKMPEEACVHSRAFSPVIENTLNNIRVLVFEEDGASQPFAYEAAIVSTTPITIRVKKSIGSKKYRLVLLANARQWVPFISTGTAKEKVLRSIQFDSAGKWKADSSTDYTPIPMWGETTTAEVISETTIYQPISLLRALARVDVGVMLNADGESAAGLNNFNLTSVSVYRSKNKGYVIPVDAPGVSIPTDAGNNNALTYSVSDNKTLIRTIYLPEVAAGTNRDNALCLVIGGKYNNSVTVTYYRVDFTLPNGSYVPLKRNSRYVVNIKKVSTEGYAQESEALTGDKNIAINGSITVDDWGSGTGNNTTGTI